MSQFSSLIPEAKSLPIYEKVGGIYTSWVAKQKRPSSAQPKPVEEPNYGRHYTLSPSTEKSKEVIIHVFDESRNVKRDFYCKKSLLMREMKYFSTYLEPQSHPLEIDVHCDVEVFEWLMGFITKQQANLDPRSAVSILISSHFLQMKSLEIVCLDYIHDHMSEVIQVPIDLKCISKELLTRLAKLFTDDELAKLEDVKDKIKSQLYLCKLSQLLGKENGHSLRLCQLCETVFSSEHEFAICTQAPLEIGFRGDLQANHRIDTSFDVNEYVIKLYQTLGSWETVYWRIWGILSQLNCTVCVKSFACVDYNTCQRHIQDPVFPDSGKGFYRCCTETPMKFAPFRIAQGCQFFQHSPDESRSSKTKDHRVTLRMFKDHAEKIVGHPVDLSNESQEANQKDGQKPQATLVAPSIFGTWSDRHPLPNRKKPLNATNLRAGWTPKMPSRSEFSKKAHLQRDEDSAKMSQILYDIMALRNQY